MAFELDHVFICTAAGAPEAASLIAFGLTEGTRNTHPGQGTANRRFFFRNAMLELVWVRDPSEAQSEPARSIHLWERWAGRDGAACPFGFCFRPAERGAGDLPFSTWQYHPPDEVTRSIPVATNAHVLAEPLLFYFDFNRRPDVRGPRDSLSITPPVSARSPASSLCYFPRAEGGDGCQSPAAARGRSLSP